MERETRMSASSVTRRGVCVALLACSAWITVPAGPVPLTMQTFVLALLPQIMTTRDASLSVLLYLLLGVAGMPVFSGFQGGPAALLGPTGGFILGFAAGTPLAGAVTHFGPLPEWARGVLGGIALLAVSYALGTLQLMNAYALDAPAALALGVVPFVVPDVAKVVLATSAARRIRRALGVSADR